MDRNIRLEELAQRAPALTENMARFYQENCVACFGIHDHSAGVAMGVEFVDTEDNPAVHWTGVLTEDQRRSYSDREKRVDHGACAIALLLISEYGNLVAVLPSSKNNGVDYFLADAKESHLIFNHSAALEVSGIQTESGSNTVNRRVQAKRKRLRDYGVSPTAHTVDLPTYICVVEFSSPKAKVVVE